MEINYKDLIDYISEKHSKDELERIKARDENWFNEHPKKFDINTQ